LINKLKITNLELNMKSVAAMQFKNAGADKKLFDLIWDGFLPVHKKLLKNEQKTIEYSKVLKNFKDVVKNLTKMDSIMIDDIEELVNIDKEFIKNQELQEPYLSDWGKLWVKLGNLFTKTETLGKAEEPDIARAENLRKLLTDEEGNLIVAEEVIQKLAELQDNEYVLFYYKKNYFVYQKLGSTLFFQPLHKLFVESELNVDKILPLLRGFAEGFKFTSNNLFFLILNKETQPTKSKFISVNSQRFSPSDPNFLKKNIEILYNNIFEALNLPEKKREEIEQQELIDEKKIKNKLSEIGKKERKTTQRELNLFSEKYKDKGILSILQEIKKELKSGTDETQEKLNILFLLLAKESFIPPLKENINKKNFWAARNSFIKNFKTNKLKFIETLKKDVERLIKFIKIPLLKDFLNTQGIILNNDEIELDDKYYLLFQNNKFVSVYNNFLLIPKFVFKTNTFFEANETKLEKIFPYPEADKDNYSFIIITKDNYNEINEIKEGFVFREDEIKEIKEDSEKRKKVIKIRNLRPLKIESLEVDFTNYSEKKELDDQKFNNLDKQEPAKKEDEDKDKDSKPLAPSGSKMQSLKHSSPEFVEAVEEEKEEFDNEFGNTQIGKRTLSKWKGIANNNPEREANINVYSAFYNEVTNNFKHKFANTPFMKKLIELSEYFLKIDLNVPDKFFQKSPEISYPAKIRYGIKDGKKTIYCLNHSTSEIAEITPNLLKKIDNDFYNYLCINLARIINFEKFKKVLAEIRIEQMPIGMSFKISEEEKKDYTRIIREALADLIRKNKFVKEILYLDSIHIIWEENYVFYNKNVLNIGFRHFEPPFDYALFKELIVEAFENPEKKAGYNEKSIMEKVEDAVEGLNQEK